MSSVLRQKLGQGLSAHKNWFKHTSPQVYAYRSSMVMVHRRDNVCMFDLRMTIVFGYKILV